MKHNFSGWLTVLIILLFSTSAMAQNLVLTGPEPLTTPVDHGVQQTPRAVQFDGQTFVFWSQRGQDGRYDILYASSWGNNWELLHITQGQGQNEHTPLPIAFDGQLFLFWSTNDLALTGGEVDIAYSVFDKQSWSWSSVMDLTAEINDYDEYNPSAVVFNDSIVV